MFSRRAESSTATQREFQTQKKNLYYVRKALSLLLIVVFSIVTTYSYSKNELLVFSCCILDNKTMHDYENSVVLEATIGNVNGLSQMRGKGSVNERKCR
jgi:hypothetical protein